MGLPIFPAHQADAGICEGDYEEGLEVVASLSEAM